MMSQLELSNFCAMFNWFYLEGNVEGMKELVEKFESKIYH